jgi:hypothetical protein
MVADLQKDFGVPQHVAVGVVGQLAAESGGFNTLQEINPMVKGSKGGWGYAQWTGPRRREFERRFGVGNDSYDANYGMLKHELTDTSESKVLDKLRGAKDSQSAGRIFTDNFLRPGIPNYSGRDKWTNRIAGLVSGDPGQQDWSTPATAPKGKAPSGGGGEAPAPSYMAAYNASMSPSGDSGVTVAQYQPLPDGYMASQEGVSDDGDAAYKLLMERRASDNADPRDVQRQYMLDIMAGQQKTADAEAQAQGDAIYQAAVQRALAMASIPNSTRRG